MKINVFPCQGHCNVSMMTKTVAKFVSVIDEDRINLLPHLNELSKNRNAIGEKYIALSGCPSACASKAYETAGFSAYDEIVITKDYDIKHNEKYKDLTDIEEEIIAVQAEIDRINVANKPITIYT